MNIYEQHQAAFKSVSAYIVTDKSGQRVATIAFKYSGSGLRTTCWLHVIGCQMVKAFASGGGYDKASAAAHTAINRVEHNGPTVGAAARDATLAMREAIKDEGRHWDGDLQAAGFNVLQAV